MTRPMSVIAGGGVSVLTSLPLSRRQFMPVVHRNGNASLMSWLWRGPCPTCRLIYFCSAIDQTCRWTCLPTFGLPPCHIVKLSKHYARLILVFCFVVRTSLIRSHFRTRWVSI